MSLMPQLEKELQDLERAATGQGPPPTGPCVMVIFGATGDLTARKLFPALYNLAKSNLLSREFAVVGVARNDYSVDQFRQIMSEKLQSFATSTVDANLRDWLLRRLYYVRGEFDDATAY